MAGGKATTFDLIVIGAGPGGTAAALRGAQLGLRTALIEKSDRLGGACAQPGGVPSQALSRAAAELRLSPDSAAAPGVSFPDSAVAWDHLRYGDDQERKGRSRRLDERLARAGVIQLHGEGRLEGPDRVRVAGETSPGVVSAPRIILATGSIPATVSGVASDGKRVISQDHLDVDRGLPASLLVVGAGAAGVEVASVWQTLGCQVTLVEKEGHILPQEDPDLAADLAPRLQAQGTTLRLKTTVRDLAVEASGVRCVLADREGTRSDHRVDSLLLAVGRRPATGDLGLDSVDVVLDRRGHLQVDSAMQTTQPGLYAVGDIVPTMGWADAARSEGLVASNHAAGQPVSPVRYNRVPVCAFSYPAVASVGLTAEAARRAGYLVSCGRYDFEDPELPLSSSGLHGFVKVVVDVESRHVLGVQVVGSQAIDLIDNVITALGRDASIPAWSDAIDPDPELSDALAGAVSSAWAAHQAGGGS